MRIIHPHPTPGRVHAFGLTFVDGFAYPEELHPEREAALRLHGYVIEGEPVGAILDLDALTKAELREIADQEGIVVPERATRADLIRAVSSAPAEHTDHSLAVREG